MIAKAYGKFLRVSPAKVRQVINLIRGKDVLSSQVILANIDRSAKEKIGKVLKSAVSNAKQKGLTEDQLVISKIVADQGPTWNRYKPAAFGRANPIEKKTTHLTVELDLKTK